MACKDSTLLFFLLYSITLLITQHSTQHSNYSTLLNIVTTLLKHVKTQHVKTQLKFMQDNEYNEHRPDISVILCPLVKNIQSKTKSIGAVDPV